MISNEKLISMYENVLSAEIDSLNTVLDATCLADFEEESPELYRFVLGIGSLRYNLYHYLKSRGLK